MTNESQEFSTYAKQAQQGDADAQFQTGWYYAQGIGVAQSYRQAAHYWLMATKQHHPNAQMYLGTLFEKGLDVSQDYVKAAQCYHTAVAQDLAEAKVRLAMLYMQGQGVAQDPKKAIALFIQAANQGDIIAQYNLGIAYDKGLGGLTQNTDQAFFWYQQAANGQHPQALQKIQAPRFAEQLAALGLTEQATDHVNPQTSDPHQADDIFNQGVKQLQSDIPTAMRHFAQAADQGHAKAQYNLGLAYLYGIGGMQGDGEKATEWLKKSAENGFRTAYVVLGWLYQIGEVAGNAIVIPDHNLATGYYEMAGELGHPQAQYFLSKIYATGNGAAPNNDTSLAWLRQSAKQGYNKAYYELEQLMP